MGRKVISTRGACVIATATAVGKKEFEGPLGQEFDFHDMTDRFGAPTFEKSESEMQRIALGAALAKAKASSDELDAIFAGDLLNQCVGSAFGLLEYDVPYFGLYGACSTAAEGLSLAAMLVSSGVFAKAAAVTSSHNAAAERQYRNPLEYGGQRTPTAQWTVTGAGAFIVSTEKKANVPPLAYISDVMPGIVVEKGITDANNMGAAMAPAALDTLLAYFEATGKSPCDFDGIYTGDLGKEGNSILADLLQISGVDPCGKLFDCGMMIYDLGGQDVHSGGSGCGCSAVVSAAHLIPKLKSGEKSSILMIGTGAMMSPSSSKQGQAIPAVAHLVHLSGKEDE
jgi:stage V sporulation protein AD